MTIPFAPINSGIPLPFFIVHKKKNYQIRIEVYPTFSIENDYWVQFQALTLNNHTWWTFFRN